MLMLRQALSRLWIAALALLALCGAASAQAPVKPCVDTVNASLGTHDCLPVSSGNPLPVAQTIAAGSGNAGYPPGATAWVVAGTGTTGGCSVQSPTPAAGKFAYLSWVKATAGTATTAIVVNVVLVGLTGNGSQTPYSNLNAPATAAGVTGENLTQTFTPAQVSNTSAVPVGISLSALGIAGANQVCAAGGYIQ